jgi:hypothetical protein
MHFIASTPSSIAINITTSDHSDSQDIHTGFHIAIIPADICVHYSFTITKPKEMTKNTIFNTELTHNYNCSEEPY